MNKIIYKVVPHDGGWAYTLDHVYLESFATRSAAQAAARRVARQHHVPGDTTTIVFEDDKGVWHAERSDGNDRPDAQVEG